MSKRENPTISKLIEIAAPVVTGAGYDLVDIEYRREQVGWVVRVYVDGAGGISFDDCERISRELGPVFDVADPIPQAYSLEVSSPGLDRPLRTPDHFRRCIGSVAKLVLERGIEGRRKFKGELVAVEDDATVVINVDGQVFRLPVGDIDSAKLVPDWDAIMTGKRQAQH